MKVKFAILSDPQIGMASQEEKKKGAIEKIISENVEFVLFPGDLTTHGRNGCWLNYIIMKLRGESVSLDKELSKFRNQFIKPLEKQNIKTFSVMGNHDTYTYPIKPVKWWIKKKHGNTFYKKNYNEQLDIIGLDIYPNKKITDWLKKQLDPNKYSILFFHYPPTGAFSDWWSDDEKKYFYEHIKNHKILLMGVGHVHNSSQYQWNNIDIIDASGKGTAIIEANLDTGIFTNKFV